MSEDYGLFNIHQLLVEALDEFDRLCKENDIQYSLHGGALLGAKRNGHLIPWDDDLDVSMTRANYEKLKQACAHYNGPYYLNEIDTWLPRFVTRDENDPLVFIDIFIWDYISANRFAQMLKINMLRMFQGMLKRNIDFNSYDWKGKFLVMVTSALGHFLPRKTKLKAFTYIGKNIFLGNRQYIHRSNDAFKGVSYIFDTDYMHDYSYIELEGKQYMVAARYEEFLVRNYGEDYLTPPPESERRPLHGVQREHFLHVIKN